MNKLFMIKIGATPKGRLIEQHDIFFGVAEDVQQLIPAVDHHWPEVAKQWHFDAYRSVTKVDDYKIQWLEQPLAEASEQTTDLKLWFINLGGYLPNHFEEFHYKMLVVAPTQAEATKKARQSEFYSQYTFKDDQKLAAATSHIDDKMQVDVDDIYDVNSLLKTGYLHITPIAENETLAEDQQVIGYIKVKRT